jgi:predicted permease
MLTLILNALVPIFAGLLLGYVAGRRGLIDNKDIRSLVALAKSAPCGSSPGCLGSPAGPRVLGAEPELSELPAGNTTDARERCRRIRTHSDWRRSVRAALSTRRSVLVASLAKLLLQPTLALGVTMLLHMSQHQIRDVMVISAIPGGFFGLVFGSSFKATPEVASSSLIASYALGWITLSMWLVVSARLS